MTSSCEIQSHPSLKCHRVGRFFLMAQGLLAIFLALVAYVLEWGHIVEGCRLCQWERGIILAGGLLSFLAGWIRFRLLFKGLGWLSLPLWIGGMGLGAYHAGIQYHLWKQPAMCSVVDAQTIKEFFAQGSLPACHERTLELFGLPGSVYVLGGCFLMAVVTFCVLKCSKKKIENTTETPAT